MKITGRRVLPEHQSEIVRFSKKRNPFNHPSVMFRKSDVIEAGGYSERFHLFEDYYLWVRMLKNGCQTANIRETLLNMRVSEDTYMRRGGLSYAKDMIRFHYWLLRTDWIKGLDFLTGTIPHVIVCLMPGGVRKVVYKILRN